MRWCEPADRGPAERQQYVDITAKVNKLDTTKHLHCKFDGLDIGYSHLLRSTLLGRARHMTCNLTWPDQTVSKYNAGRSLHGKAVVAEPDAAYF